jgi:uncharacterized protein
MRIENAFEVPGPPKQAWELLNDLSRVVPCLPGAELTEIVDQDTFKVTFHIKLGAISLTFGTDLKRAEADAAAGRVVISASARELKGRGGARGTITAQLSEQGTGTRVEIVTQLSLQGGVAQYGRSIVVDVAERLTKQFAARLAEQLEQSRTPAS